MPNPNTLAPYATRRIPHGIKGEVIPPFGSPPGDVSAIIQSDVFKALINKISWAIGSTYKKRYSGKNTDVTNYARMCAHAIIRDHGYPQE